MRFTLTRGIAAALVMTFLLGACGDVAAPDEAGRLTDLGSASTIRCAGLAGGSTVGSVEVRRGARCTLTDVTVRGNVKVLEGASLELVGGTVLGNVEGNKAFGLEVRGTRVDGNIQVQESQFAIILDATVGGSIQVKETRHPGDGIVLVAGTTLLAGNIQIEDNHVRTLDVSENVVSGNVQVLKNVGSGQKLVVGNRVAQNLQCAANASPFTAADNLADDREGQCE